MSFTALLGALFGVGLFCLSIFLSTDRYDTFFSVSSLLMVFGGTTASTYMSYPAREVNRSFKAIWWMFKKPISSRESLDTEIMRLVKWSYITQKNGLPALENEIKKVPDTDGIIRFCLGLVVTDHKPDELRGMMETAVESHFERCTVPADILKMMSAAAPAFGMIGTLVGLIVMLQNFGDDLSEIGTGLSLALITTLYGVVFSRLIFNPASLQLQQKEEVERFRNYMVIEGLMMLAEKKGPRYMQDKMNSYLDPDIMFDIDKQLKSSS